MRRRMGTRTVDKQKETCATRSVVRWCGLVDLACLALESAVQGVLGMLGRLTTTLFLLNLDPLFPSQDRCLYRFLFKSWRKKKSDAIHFGTVSFSRSRLGFNIRPSNFESCLGILPSLFREESVIFFYTAARCLRF